MFNVTNSKYVIYTDKKADVQVDANGEYTFNAENRCQPQMVIKGFQHNPFKASGDASPLTLKSYEIQK